MKYLMVATMVAGLATCAQAATQISLKTDSNPVILGDSFELTITADLPVGIIGFGFDAIFDSDFFDVQEMTIGPDFTALHSPDGDNLAGISYPEVVQGQDIVLVVMKLVPLQSGETVISGGGTEGDLMEGFPYLKGGFSEFMFEPLTLLIEDEEPAEPMGSYENGSPAVPEPGSLLLLVGGAVACLRKRM